MATWSKEVFATNLKYYMGRKRISQKELAEVVGVSAPALNDWIKAKKYPRIDKIEMLADFFGCLKSDLIEDKQKQSAESELSIEKKELIEKVMQMSDEELQKLDLLLRIVESK